jgi:hypothetical protein
MKKRPRRGARLGLELEPLDHERSKNQETEIAQSEIQLVDKPLA